jgi:soluble cytochrome b562
MRTWIRRYLGITNLEETMAKVIDLLNGLVAQQTAASAAQAASFSNLQAAITRLETAVANSKEADPEVEAAVQALTDGFNTLQQAANDADNGFEPAEPEQPVEPGDEPAVPVEGEPTGGDVLPEDNARRGR